MPDFPGQLTIKKRSSNYVSDLVQYADLLSQIKQRIRHGQTLAVMSANAEMIGTYWDVGKMINDRQKLEGWGAAVIPRLSRDIHNELPDIKGFSERNIKRMLSFYREYSSCSEIVPQAVAQIETSGKVPQLVAQTATPAMHRTSPAPFRDTMSR